MAREPREEVRIEHYVLLPRLDELPQRHVQRYINLPRPARMQGQEYDEFVQEWEEHLEDREHEYDREERHRYLKRLDDLRISLEESISKFDGHAKKTLVAHLDNPAHLLQLAKERPEFHGFEEALKPEIADLLHDRPIINLLYCGQKGVEHRKMLYYLLSRKKGIEFVGNGEVPIGRTVHSGPYRVDQLYSMPRGALFVEISAEMPGNIEFHRKLRLIEQSVQTARKLHLRGKIEYPHLERAWGDGKHSVAFFWGAPDLGQALHKILKSEPLMKRIRNYPHDVLLMTYQPRTHDVHGWSIKKWLQEKGGRPPGEHERQEWAQRMPRAF